MSSKVSLSYERFFQTVADEITLRSADVAAADLSCSDRVCVCKHVLICETAGTLQKLLNMTSREQLVISEPARKHSAGQEPAARGL